MATTTKRDLVGTLVGVSTLGVAAAALSYWYIRPIATWQPTNNSCEPHRSLLLTYLPEAEFAGEVSTLVHATPSAIVDAMQRVTLHDMPLANWLGKLRYLPGKLFSKNKVTTSAPDTMPFLQQIQGEGGNIALGERAGAEYVIGAIGKFHNLQDQQFVLLRAPHEFVAFDHPDYQKLAMSFTITPLGDGSGCCLRLTHGTHALSQEARLKFGFYWLAIKPFGNLVSWLMLRAIKGIAEKSSVPHSSIRSA